MSHPTNSRRNKRQKIKEAYSRLREAAQLYGIIPTTPEGAVRDERVKPETQSNQQIPSLDKKAIMAGWAIPEEHKPKVVERLLEPFLEEQRTVVMKDGREVTLPPDREIMVKNAKVLAQLDKMQYERDHPEEAAKAKGSINITQNTLVTDLNALMQKVDEQVKEYQPPQQSPSLPSTNGNGHLGNGHQ